MSKSRRVVIMVLVVALALAGMATTIAGVSAVSGSRPAQWVCPAGGNCHVLLEPGSEVHFLCAGDGSPNHFELDINGADSLRAGCPEQ